MHAVIDDHADVQKVIMMVLFILYYSLRLLMIVGFIFTELAIWNMNSNLHSFQFIVSWYSLILGSFSSLVTWFLPPLLPGISQYVMTN